MKPLYSAQIQASTGEGKETLGFEKVFATKSIKIAKSTQQVC